MKKKMCEDYLEIRFRRINGFMIKTKLFLLLFVGFFYS